MNDLDNFIDTLQLAKENNFKRTIANFRILTDNIKLHNNIYNEITNLIIKYDKFSLFIKNFSDNKFLSENIKEIKFCNISKKENRTICLLNPMIINNIVKNNKRLKPTNKIEIYNNKNNIYTQYLTSFKNNYYSYTKKKNKKEKLSVEYFKKVEFDNKTINYKETNSKNHYMKIIPTKLSYIIKTNYILKLFLNEDKIETSGRIMLPMTIAVTLVDESRITIHNKKYIQIIPSKNVDEDLDQFTQKINNMLKIVNTLMKNNNSLNNILFNCDFTSKNLLSDRDVLPFVDKHYSKKIKLNNNNINIKNITSKKELEQCLNYLDSTLKRTIKIPDNILFLNENDLKSLITDFYGVKEILNYFFN